MTAVARTTAFQREEDLDAGAVEQAAERAGLAEGLEEQEPDRRRRQHERQRQERFDDGAQRPAAPRARRHAAAIPSGRIRSVAIAATRSVSSRTERSSAITYFAARTRKPRFSKTARPAGASRGSHESSRRPSGASRRRRARPSR